MSDGEISVRARFERFPATVKGAFVVRGEDADPHQVVFRRARVVAAAEGPVAALAAPSAVLDVAPHEDVFVPFELSVADLSPGWYGLECDLDVDGHPGTFTGGRRFLVPWPRAAVRRGQVSVGRRLAIDDGPSVRIEHVECAGDSIRIHLEAAPPEPVAVRLFADGSRHVVLEVDVDEETGRGRVTAYPALKQHRLLRIEVAPRRGRARGREASVEIELP